MVSRNAPCHCGSGKKFKKCCMNSNQGFTLGGVRAGEQMYVEFLGNKNRVNTSLNSSNDQGYVELLDLGILYKRTGHYEKAKETYIQAIKLEPKRSMAYYNLGKILYILEEYEASVKSYQTALELGHKKLEPMRHLGYSLLAQNIEPSDENVMKYYLQSINPTKRYTYKKPTQAQITGYEKRCVEAAQAYLEAAMKGQ
ncbi:tetratricopeptide repeat protein [Lysinibacillus sp. K60]|uniref:tetratricopeptide repeat protein n=1 Tax=Lysinibacillus sp. K60 TaxID=2720027 RepID=UPI0021023947|nr:tetratricopeptide repeat protein [Lysinibacillus sp. K60]MBX8946813.1 tetratricopeptide repeat protein [Lysinibacillus sp. K60]